MPGSTSSSSSSDEDVKNCPNKFLIISSLNGKVVDVAGKKKGEGVPVVMYRKKRFGGKNQMWYLDEKGYIRSAFSDCTMLAAGTSSALKTSKNFTDANGQWKVNGESIVNEKGLYLDIVKAKNADGAELCAYKGNGEKNQKWSIKYV